MAASSPFPRFLSRLFATSSAPTDSYWHLLRSHSQPPPPLETTLSNSIPNPPTPSLISSIVNTAASPSDRRLALRFFVWAGLHPLHRHSPASYSAASASLRLPSDPQLLHSLLDSYTLESSPVSLKTFRILINLCLHSDLGFPLALSIFRRMADFGCRPDVPIYNSLLRLSSTPAGAAFALFNEMKELGLRPDMIAYVTVIKKLCASGDGLDDARDLVSRMKGDGCSPNVVVYSALLDGACECGDLKAALEILEEMEEGRDGDCAPNVVSYTCLMKFLCENGRLEEALGVLDRMGQNGCRPNRVTVRTLLKGFCKEGRVNDAYKIAENMVGESGGVSSDECYSLLVVCLLRVGDGEAAEELLGRMVERGVRPDGVACNSVLREICEKRRFFDGYNWVVVLEEKETGCVDSDVYSCLLAGLCEKGHFVEAVKLGRKVAEKGIRVEDSCMDCVVEAMVKIGESDLASQITGVIERNCMQ